MILFFELNWILFALFALLCWAVWYVHKQPIPEEKDNQPNACGRCPGCGCTKVCECSLKK